MGSTLALGKGFDLTALNTAITTQDPPSVLVHRPQAAPHCGGSSGLVVHLCQCMAGLTSHDLLELFSFLFSNADAGHRSSVGYHYVHEDTPSARQFSRRVRKTLIVTNSRFLSLESRPLELRLIKTEDQVFSALCTISCDGWRSDSVPGSRKPMLQVM